jgi:hypothetical protein
MVPQVKDRHRNNTSIRYSLVGSSNHESYG